MGSPLHSSPPSVLTASAPSTAVAPDRMRRSCSPSAQNPFSAIWMISAPASESCSWATRTSSGPIPAISKQAAAAATVGAQESAAVARGEGAVAERTRIAAILGSDDAKTRPALATKLAFDLGMDADAAAVILAAAAVEAPVQAEATTSVAAPKGMFDAAMGDGKDGLSAGVPAPASEADLAERDPNAYLAALRARA